MEEILVSIHCITYNHEKYIADAIESFLLQKTHFQYEILIHDDASTDRTPEIIKQYVEKYPKIIKPIFQSENQYSKGRNVELFNEKRAKGKYLAWCEGDDYWSDPYKLQKQVDYMEKHPECSLCVHAGYVVSASNNKLKYYNRPNKGSKIFLVDEVIEGGGGLFLSNSMVYPTRFVQNKPKLFESAPVGDYPLTIYLAHQGTVYYIDEYMSAYRVGDPSSWTERIASDGEKILNHYVKSLQMLDNINQYTNYKYESAILRKKISFQFSMLLQQKKYKKARSGKFRELYLELGIKRKIIILIDQYFPSILKLLRLAKRKLVR